MSAYLTVEHLAKKYGDRVLFDDLNFSISGGEVFSVVGASGSGKSTLLNLLGLLHTPSGGRILWHGQSISNIRSKQARRCIRDHIGYLFQNYALLDTETVEKNLQVALAYRSDLHSGRERNQAVENALSEVDLSGMQKQKVYTLSGGEQQRVALARLLIKPASIILADEPTGNLDRENARQVLDLLYRFADQGKAVVIVTHEPELLSRVSQTVILRRVVCN